MSGNPLDSKNCEVEKQVHLTVMLSYLFLDKCIARKTFEWPCLNCTFYTMFTKTLTQMLDIYFGQRKF